MICNTYKNISNGREYQKHFLEPPLTICLYPAPLKIWKFKYNKQLIYNCQFQVLLSKLKPAQIPYSLSLGLDFNIFIIFLPFCISVSSHSQKY